MKKILLATVAGLSFVSGAAFAEKVKDWHDLEKVHQHVKEALAENERAQKDNHYDMDGHGHKVDVALREAEKELREEIEAAKKAK